MNLSTVKSIVIPEGNATSFSIGGVKVWSVPQPSGSPWDEVAAAIADGTYKTKYKIGDMVPLDLGSEGLINMQIAAFDVDTLADGSGTAAISWVAKELLTTNRRMNPARAGSSGAYTEGTGTIGGWEKCEMRAYLQSTIKQSIPVDVASMIQPVTKKQSAFDTAGTSFVQTTTDDVWLPSAPELTMTNPGYGVRYGDFFTNNTSRIKCVVSGDKKAWWVRNSTSASNFTTVTTAGTSSSSNAQTETRYICLGFCTGRTPT